MRKMGVAGLSLMALMGWGYLSGVSIVSDVCAAPAKISPARILVIDLSAIIQGSKAFHGIQKEGMKYNEKIQKELSSDQKKLQVLSEDKTKKNEMKKLLEKIEKKTDMRRYQFNMALERAMVELQEKLLEVVEGIQKERGADLILNKMPHTVVLADSSLNATDDVLKAFDKAFPSCDVKFPSEKEAKEYREKQEAALIQSKVSPSAS